MQSNSDHGMNSRLCGFGVFLLVLGVAGYGGIKLAESRIEKTAHWPKVTGRIVTSEVATAIVKTGPVRRASDVATIRYAYSVGGREFVCDRERVVPMLHYKPDGTPEETVRRYPVGRSVDVYDAAMGQPRPRRSTSNARSGQLPAI